MDRQIVVYKSPDGSELPVKTDGETVWLTQEQMCRLFGRERTVITKHINNVFREGELPKEGFVQILHKTSPDGCRGRRHQADQGRHELSRPAAFGPAGSAPPADRLWRRRVVDQAIWEEVIYSCDEGD